MQNEDWAAKFAVDNLPDDGCIHDAAELADIVRDVLLRASVWIEQAEGRGIAHDFLHDHGLYR